MKLSILLTIASIYMGLVGLGLIFVPQYFGIGAVPADASPELIHFLRIWGSPLLGIALLNWITRNEGPSKSRNAIIFGNIVGFGTIAAIDLWGMFSGARPLTIVFVCVHLLFALAFIFVGRKSMSGASRI
jgi:hypothetical protein